MDDDYYKFELKHIFFAAVGALIIIGALVFFPAGNKEGIGLAGTGEGVTGRAVLNAENLNDITKTREEYYSMFQCSCCGRPISAECCGMAKQRKEYLDSLLLKGTGEKDVLYEMVKKFGFDVLMDQSREQEVRDYIKSRSPENPPRIEVEPAKHDFGTISQSEGNISTDFTIKNSGKSDLVIENLDTSCMCTTASLIYDGKESPVFGMSMHGNNPENFELRIPPGETAVLRVYYNPMAHGIQKKPEARIIREVTIISNDPVDFQKKVRIELTQTP
ncbi:DUF1573 domain-containing protein [Candidatus Woesearchaeota archaeon]|nr:MAG: DUF1573 domain-containing protein [Candidatus Woesearchaeota archaeon]